MAAAEILQERMGSALSVVTSTARQMDGQLELHAPAQLPQPARLSPAGLDGCNTPRFTSLFSRLSGVTNVHSTERPGVNMDVRFLRVGRYHDSRVGVRHSGSEA